MAVIEPSSRRQAHPRLLWPAVHVFESAERGRSAQYKLTSTVMLYMTKPVQAVASETNKGEGEVALGGSMTRQVRTVRRRCSRLARTPIDVGRVARLLAQHELTAQLDTTSASTLAQSHIVNVGKLVEDMELKMRNLLQEVYFSSAFQVAPLPLHALAILCCRVAR